MNDDTNLTKIHMTNLSKDDIRTISSMSNDHTIIEWIAGNDRYPDCKECWTFNTKASIGY